MSPLTDARGWRTWTLRRQLVLGVSAVVMVVLLAVGTVSVLTLHTSVTGIINAQLSASANGFSYSVTKYRITPLRDGSLPPPGAMKPLTQLIGQAPGNVAALVQDGEVVDSALFQDGEAQPAPAAALGSIADLPWSDGSPRAVELPGLGDYLMVSRPGDAGEYFVNGVSLRPTQEAVSQETTVVAVMTAVALAVTALATWLLVRFALCPLRRVASTASEVATLPLDREHYAITPRVAAQDTDPRTEVGRVGDTLNQLLDNVERALSEVSASDRRMRQFITDASHELRTPLAAIQGYAELTRQDSSELPETTDYSLERIEAEAQRMHALVTDLLLLARLDEGEEVMATEVDLTDVVMVAVGDARVSAPDHRWPTLVPDEPIWVAADRAKLHQLIVNLLSNARVHTPAGTTVTTGVAIGRVGDGSACAELTVSDDGPGIPPDVLPHLFERFVRADKSRSSAEGSFGLGLAIVASIAEAHDGSISVESAGGRTTFRVRLPLIDQPVSTATAEVAAEALPR